MQADTLVLKHDTTLDGWRGQLQAFRLLNTRFVTRRFFAKTVVLIWSGGKQCYISRSPRTFAVEPFFRPFRAFSSSSSILVSGSHQVLHSHDISMLPLIQGNSLAPSLNCQSYTRPRASSCKHCWRKKSSLRQRSRPCLCRDALPYQLQQPWSTQLSQYKPTTGLISQYHSKHCLRSCRHCYRLCLYIGYDVKGL